MTGDLAALLIASLLTLLFVSRRTHVSITTMALCGGYVLSDRITYTLSQEAGDYLSGEGPMLYTAFKLILLFGPPAFVAFHFRGTQHGPGRFLEQLVPAFALSLLVIVFILEQLPFEQLNYHLDNSIVLNQLWLYSAWIVLFAFSASLFDLLLHKPSQRSRKHHHKV